MKRRKFITLLGGAAIWPFVARAQQADGIRSVGVLMDTAPEQPASEARVAALQQGLQEAGWSVGRNLRIDIRWSAGDSAKLNENAKELVALAPNVIVAGVGPTVQALQRASLSIPIVMAQAVDPVGAGFVAKLSRPGGNTTGFAQFEYGLSAKWPELLKEIDPTIATVGVVRDQEVGSGAVVGIGQWAVIQASASSSGIELYPINLSLKGDTSRELAAFAQASNAGLIVAVGTIATIQYQSIISLAARYRVPTIYPYRFFVEAGGLLSYGPNLIDLYHRTASYVDRILKGEKPADLPVQAPTKYELVINRRTAGALGLTISPSLLASADEIIE
jgi:putative ABC transport system substrate-binding protein